MGRTRRSATAKLRVLTAVVIVSGSMLAGCASGGVHVAGGGGGGPAEPIEAARALADAPRAVRGLDSPSCGAIQLDQGEDLPDTARACLDRAIDQGGTAELAWSYPTTEGDPIVSFAFVEPGDTDVLVATTSAFDSWGGGDTGWSWSRCPGLTPHGVSADCSEVDDAG